MLSLFPLGDVSVTSLLPRFIVFSTHAVEDGVHQDGPHVDPFATTNIPGRISPRFVEPSCVCGRLLTRAVPKTPAPRHCPR